MANLNIQNRQNAVQRDLRFFGSASGASFTLYPSRYSKYTKVYYTLLSNTLSLFPRTSGQAFNDGLTTLNFLTGTISGADQISPDFTAPSIGIGNAVIGLISVNSSDVLKITFGTVKSIASAQGDWANNAFPLSRDAVPLWGVLITNLSGTVSITNVADLRPDFAAITYSTKDLVISSNTQFNYKLQEYLDSNALSGASTLAIRSTNLQTNDLITLTSATGSQNLTVTGVTKSLPVDSVSVSPVLNQNFNVADNAQVLISTYANFSQAAVSRGRILYDSNWQSVSVNASQVLSHGLGLNTLTYSFLVFGNTTQTMDGARLLHQWADGGLTQTYGVQITMSFTTATFKFGNTALYQTFNASGQVLGSIVTGFFRAIAVAH